MKRSPGPALVAALLVAASLGLGARLPLYEVQTAHNLLFDVMIDSSMGMSNGLRDAYDGCYLLRVASREVRTPSVTFLFGGRGVQSPRLELGGLTVSRQLYMPADDDWARYYDLIINSSKTAQTVEVELYGNLGSDSSTKVVSTSDGDLLIEPTDSWFATDDFADGSGDPALAHVFRRANGKLRPESVSLDLDNISIRYQLKLAPSQRAAILFYAVQTEASAEATKIARELVDFGARARAHLSAEDLRSIRN